MEKTIEEEEVIIADECGDTLWEKVLREAEQADRIDNALIPDRSGKQ